MLISCTQRKDTLKKNWGGVRQGGGPVRRGTIPWISNWNPHFWEKSQSVPGPRSILVPLCKISLGGLVCQPMVLQRTLVLRKFFNYYYRGLYIYPPDRNTNIFYFKETVAMRKWNEIHTRLPLYLIKWTYN